MPYSSNKDLPDSVKSKLSNDRQSQWREVFNQSISDGLSEERAFQNAWGVVKVQKAEYQGREVDLDKPFRTPKGPKKFAVYVKDGDTVKIVRFGDPNMEIRRDDPEARANFRSRHNCDSKTDKTTAGYWSCRMWDLKSVSDITKSSIEGQVLKTDESQRIVMGWASVISENGEPVIDRQGDIIKADELFRATTEFMKSARDSLRMHTGNKIGTVVHSFPMTKEIAKSVGIETNREGWLVGIHVADDKVWKSVQSGELSAFSIGGSAERVEV